jgi:AraC-like DNA-binding protein
MIRSLVPGASIGNARPVRTRDYSVEIQHCGPAELPPLYHHMHLVSVALDDQVVLRGEGETALVHRYSSGMCSVRGAGFATRVTWPRVARFLHIHVHPRLVRRIAATLYGPVGVTLRSTGPLSDRCLREAGNDLLGLIAAGPPLDRTRAHDLVMAIAHHVTARYAAAAGAPVHIGGRHIEEVLDEFRDGVATWDSVTAAADRCGLTRAHFSRRVRALAGISPYTLVRASRIEAAKHLIEQGATPLTTIAYETGFCDQSHLIRAFRRATAMTPEQFRLTRPRARA